MSLDQPVPAPGSWISDLALVTSFIHFQDGSSQLETLQVLDFEGAANIFKLRVKVTDGGGLFGRRWYMVRVEDVNEAPFLAATNRSVAENTNAYFPVGSPLVATDPDILSGQELKYTLVSSSRLFKIDYCTGQIYVFTAMLDFETRSEYITVVRVSIITYFSMHSEVYFILGIRHWEAFALDGSKHHHHYRRCKRGSGMDWFFNYIF